METLNHDNKKSLYSNNNNHASSTAEVQVDNIPKEKSKEGICCCSFRADALEITLHEINMLFLCEILCETDTNKFEAIHVFGMKLTWIKNIWNLLRKMGIKIYTYKLAFFFLNIYFLLEIKCSLFFQIYTKKLLNITREQKRRSSTPSLAPYSMIYTSLWSSRFWVEGLAMEVLHVGVTPPPTPPPNFPFLHLDVKKTSSCNKTFKAMLCCFRIQFTYKSTLFQPILLFNEILKNIHVGFI